MTYEEAIKVIESNRPTSGYTMLCEALDIAKEAIEKQIPKKPYLDNDNGIYEKEYCPACNRSLFPNDPYCRCGQKLDWGEEK